MSSSRRVQPPSAKLEGPVQVRSGRSCAVIVPTIQSDTSSTLRDEVRFQHSTCGARAPLSPGPLSGWEAEGGGAPGSAAPGVVFCSRNCRAVSWASMPAATAWTMISSASMSRPSAIRMGMREVTESPHLECAPVPSAVWHFRPSCVALDTWLHPAASSTHRKRLGPLLRPCMSPPGSKA